MKSLFFTLASLFIFASAYSQQQSRLLYITGDSKTDSSHYYYSNGRGGGYYDADFLPWCHAANIEKSIFDLIEPSSIQYDSLISFRKDQNVKKYNLLYKYLQLFNISNQCTITVSQGFNEDSNKLITGGTTQYSYDLQGNLITVLLPSNKNINVSINYQYTYDNNNRIISSLYEYFNTATQQWQTTGETFFTYDANGNIVSADFKDYMYGHDGHLECTYNVNNQLIQVTSYGYVYSPTWLYNKRIYSFVYDNNDNNISGAIEIDTTGTLHLLYKFDAYYNANNLVDSVITYDYDLHNRKAITRLYHNSFNQVTQAEEEQWDLITNTGLGAGTGYYTYELYYPTAIHEVPVASANMKLYPSPAKENITLDIEWKTAQPFNLTITDVLGRIWTRWTSTSAKNYQTHIDVSALPTGNYWMIVQGENGKTTKQFSIVR